jgi:hypothetical protein
MKLPSEPKLLLLDRRALKDVVIVDQVAQEKRLLVGQPETGSHPNSERWCRAEEHGASFHRIEALAKADNQMRVLDLQRKEVRDGILSSDWVPLKLHESDLAVDYDSAKA